MKVGIFTDTYYPQVSGVATSIKTLKKQLERQGHTVYIFTTTDPNVDKNVYERNIFRFTSIPFISFTERRIAVRGLFHAYQVAKKLQLDIVHTQTEFSMGLIGKFVAHNLHIPCVHTYHTMYEDYLHYVANGKLLRPVHVKQMSKVFCAHMAGIVAPSERVLITLRGYGVTEPITVIPTGVDLERYQEDGTIARQRLRQQYGLAPDTPVILTLSRLALEKHIDRLIAALPRIKAAVPGVKLMVCGDGPAREELEAQVAALGVQRDVIFTGEIRHAAVADYYHAADLFVSTSESESQGLTYIEALAAGLQVITTHSPYTDQLLDNPALGVPVAGQDELVAAVRRYLTGSAPQMTPAVRAPKLAMISADHFGEQIIAFYRQALAQPVVAPVRSRHNANS